MAGMKDALDRLLKKIRRCRVCAAHLPLGPRPVVRASTTASLLIVGQAPGRRVHETGIPWNDPSGDRLRAWLELSREEFYDVRKIAIVPMGFCYPGRGPHGDLPPRPECALLWHARLRALMPRIRLTLLVGAHAQASSLGKRRKASMTQTVAAAGDYLPEFFPLPHPSPRNTHWLQTHPWFERRIIPLLRRAAHRALDATEPPPAFCQTAAKGAISVGPANARGASRRGAPREAKAPS